MFLLAVYFLMPDWLVSCNIMTFQKYFWCSWFSWFDCKKIKTWNVHISKENPKMGKSIYQLSNQQPVSSVPSYGKLPCSTLSFAGNVFFVC